MAQATTKMPATAVADVNKDGERERLQIPKERETTLCLGDQLADLHGLGRHSCVHMRNRGRPSAHEGQCVMWAWEGFDRRMTWLIMQNLLRMMLRRCLRAQHNPVA